MLIQAGEDSESTPLTKEERRKMRRERKRLEQEAQEAAEAEAQAASEAAATKASKQAAKQAAKKGSRDTSASSTKSKRGMEDSPGSAGTTPVGKKPKTASSAKKVRKLNLDARMSSEGFPLCKIMPITNNRAFLTYLVCRVGCRSARQRAGAAPGWSSSRSP